METDCPHPVPPQYEDDKGFDGDILASLPLPLRFIDTRYAPTERESIGLRLLGRMGFGQGTDAVLEAMEKGPEYFDEWFENTSEWRTLIKNCAVTAMDMEQLGVLRSIHPLAYAECEEYIFRVGLLATLDRTSIAKYVWDTHPPNDAAWFLARQRDLEEASAKNPKAAHLAEMLVTMRVLTSQMSQMGM